MNFVRRYPIVGWILLFLVFVVAIVGTVIIMSYKQNREADKARMQGAIAWAHVLQAEALGKGEFALITIPGPTNYISTIKPSGFVVGTPRMEINEIVRKTEFFNYPKEIQLLDIDGHVVDQFEFGQTILPGDLVIAWYTDPAKVSSNKFPVSFLDTYPRYWNPDTGFAVSIIHSVVETP